MMTKYSLLLLSTLLLASVTSCKTAQKSVASPEPEPEATATVRNAPAISREEFDGTWIVKSAERHEVVGDEPVELTFDLTNGRLYGSDGCNVIHGTFTLGDENELQFGSLISTSKVCRPEVTDRAVLNALNHTRSYKRADNHDLSIKLCNRRGRTVMTLVKRMTYLLNGPWKVTAINGTPVPDEQPVLVIDIPEAKLSGFAGCNRLFGHIALDDTPYGITFTQVAATRKMCPEMDTEQNFLSALDQVTGFYPVDDTHIILYQAPETPLITLEKGL